MNNIKSLERITLFHPFHIMSVVDPTAISVEIPRIYSRFSLEKDFITLIYFNP